LVEKTWSWLKATIINVLQELRFGVHLGHYVVFGLSR
jgi:hypothetical protein